MKPFLHQQLTHSLLIEAASGAYADDERFISRRTIQQRWQVSRHTAERSIEELEQQNIVARADRKALSLTTNGVRRARLLLRRDAVAGLPPADNWEVRARRLTRNGRVEGRKLILLLDAREERVDRAVAAVEAYTLEDARKRITGCWDVIGFIHKANSHFCATELIYFSDCGGSLERILQLLENGGGDGVAVFQRTNSKSHRELCAALKSRGLPVVTVRQDCEGVADAAVDFNNIAAGYDAMAALLNRGHRRIVVVHDQHLKVHIEDRLKGALDCQRDVCADAQVEVVQPRELAAAIKRPVAERPTAALFTYLHQFATVAPELRKRRVRIPRDLSVIGCGSGAFSDDRCGYGQLDTLELDYSGLGQLAADVLIQLTGGTPVERTYLLNAPLLERGSVGTFTGVES